MDEHPVAAAEVTVVISCPACGWELEPMLMILEPDTNLICEQCLGPLFAVQEIPEILEREWK